MMYRERATGVQRWAEQWDGASWHSVVGNPMFQYEDNVLKVRIGAGHRAYQTVFAGDYVVRITAPREEARYAIVSQFAFDGMYELVDTVRY